MHCCQFFVSADQRLTFDVETRNSNMSETVSPSRTGWQLSLAIALFEANL
jgi:hypothetical protein